MAKSVKLADIAVKLNVSTVTVSKALSDQKGVSEELREKIKKLADEMGYRQPSAIKREAENTSYNIGVIISEMFLDKYDSFYWQMYQAVTQRAVAKGCFTLLEVVSKDDEIKLQLPKLVQEQKVDGVIVIGRLQDAYLQCLNTRAGVPVIYLDFYDEKESCDAVISNSYFGSYMLTNYLFEMGHTKIGYVGTILATDSITDRYFGYAKALMEHKVTIKKEWIIEDRISDIATIEVSPEDIIRKDMPTAFVCNCDLTASYVIKILQDKGYRVPEDVSIVGFDNYLYPGMSNIGITSYEVDFKEMARRIIHNIIKKIATPNYKPSVVIVQGRVVHKDSVAKISE
ncbi:LacI family DNA-binding transcriptional regulator [Anaerosporobacter faecicola]|uniref:LacI family DNA-binding transcriptional regulator n=1 Tax=Anaerosporobacter faecicola TaxID=2718714 RepID=UPI00143B22BC|nr:LacI family DNA-binding transcriptional regulator [Anaerosporobacter faecicola]